MNLSNNFYNMIRIPILFPIFILVVDGDDRFIFYVAILLIIIHICIFFTTKMPKKYHCPQCKSENIIEYEDYLECTQCGLTFFKEIFDSNIDEENLLAEEDLHEFMNTFNELKDEKTRKRFLKSLKKDFDL